MAYFPLLIDLDGMYCLVSGGGRLALHKAELLLQSGADVTVIAPEISPELAALPVRQLRRAGRASAGADGRAAGRHGRAAPASPRRV